MKLDNANQAAILSDKMNAGEFPSRPQPSGLSTGARWFFIFIFLFTLAFNSPAQDLALNDKKDLTDLPLEALMQIEVPTVYGASKIEQKTTEAPASVTIINAEDIKRYGYRTLADILKSAQGLYVSYDRNYSFLGSRGVNLGDFNSRMLVLVNGHRLNNNLTDGAGIGTEFILDVDLIDHVEIIRGPSAVLYGDNAFFGVINVVTRTGKQVDGGELSGSYAQFNAFTGRLTYGKSFTNGVQFLLSGSGLDSGGSSQLFYSAFNTPSQNNGIADNLDGDLYESFFGNISYKDFSIEGAFIHRKKDNPTAQFFTTFNAPGLTTTDDRSYVNLKYAHKFDDTLDASAQVYYDRSDFEIGYPETPTFFDEKQAGQWVGTEVQVNKRVWQKHVLTVGAEYRNDFQQHRDLSEPSTGAVFTDANRDRQSYGIYFQGDFEIMTNLHFNGGVRLDQYGDFDPAIDPRLALIYNPFKTSTLKAIYGTAFRVPNFLELSDPRFQDVQPEKITSYELVYEQEIGRYLRSSISGYYNQMDDLISLQSGSFTNFNANSEGLEIALEGHWTNGIRTRASYTLQQTENDANQDLADSPHQMFKLNLSVPLYQQKIFAGLEFQYLGRRHTVFTASDGTTAAGPDVAGFGVLNFTVFSENLVKNLEFSASIYNLLDTSYDDPATRFHQQSFIPQDGRTFRLKLTYRF